MWKEPKNEETPINQGQQHVRQLVRPPIQREVVRNREAMVVNMNQNANKVVRNV